MKGLYSSPLRVYLCLALLALAGVWCGSRLPVSLFPNSSRPVIAVNGDYGGMTADEFLDSYGRSLEAKLQQLNDSSAHIEVEKLTANYWSDSFRYEVRFKWGAEPQAALREVQTTVNAYGAQLPKDVRDSLGIWNNNEEGGFLAVSFYSATRAPDELYRVLEPIFGPKLSKVRDAQEAVLWNPTKKEINVELNPVAMATLGLFPRDIQTAIYSAMGGRTAGQVTVGADNLSIQMPRDVNRFDDLAHVLVPTSSGNPVHLGDVARIDIAPSSDQAKIFKTNGAPSVLLWGSPKPGGNIKRMAEEMLAIVHEVEPTFPADVKYRVLVDPSEFIRHSIDNVFHEVLIGAGLAVLVLFIFIGSLRNTITAAIEIPMSMVLAFILMRISGMNLNLISLGGLALSAGMNVDGSVVVMENIFRHFDLLSPSERARLTARQRLDLVARAVSEVRFSLIASTLASLVVFIPLAFTSELTHAILGDLALTVVFSHGFSALVALVLVPTVRLQLLSSAARRAEETGVQPKSDHSPIESQLHSLERGYGTALGRFIDSRRLRYATYAGAALALTLLLTLGLPRLPREVIGRPDTDWVGMSVRTDGNTRVRQMETQVDEVEARLLSDFGDQVLYTFVQVRGPNRGSIMARLKDKRDMNKIWKALEEKFTDTPFMRFNVWPWNPSELPIPDPPHMRLVISGGDAETRASVGQDLSNLLNDKKAFPKIWSDPGTGFQKNVVIRPQTARWYGLKDLGARFTPSDLAELSRVATQGRRIGDMVVPEAGNSSTDIMLRYPVGSVETVEDIGALPIGVGGRLLPLKALADVAVEYMPPTILREDGRALTVLSGREKMGDDALAAGDLKKSEAAVAEWKTKRGTAKITGPEPVVYFEDAQKELTDALTQLGLAVGLSLLLMFLTLVLQFGNPMNALLVLVAVPLGLIGVLTSLLVFRSTLSLNSALGVILLNGIAVANSILLIDFQTRMVAAGLSPREAAIEAGRKRLRPILITSLTTILGMMPIALGLGDGGRILQPLGIAVSGGLWVSMGLTLFIVPALYTSWLEWRLRHGAREKIAEVTAPLGATLVAGGLTQAIDAFDAELDGSVLHATTKTESEQYLQ